MSDLVDVLSSSAYRQQAQPDQPAPDSTLPSLLSSSAYNSPAFQNQERLREAKQAESGQEESAGGYILRRSIPFVSPIHNFLRTREYGHARERLRAGTPTNDDFQTIAQYERLQEIDANRTTGESVGSALAHIPAILGEGYVGGAALRGLGMAAEAAPRLGIMAGASAAVTNPASWGRTAALTGIMPSMYLPGTAERAVQNGGEWYNPKNIIPAYAMGFMQTAILNSLGGLPGKADGGMVSQIARRTLAGMVEQQGVDILGGAMDLALPEAWQTHTRFGLLGNLVRGEGGELGKHFAVQAVTFAAFAAMHGGRDAREAALESIKAEAARLTQQGMSREAAQRTLLEAMGHVDITITDAQNREAGFQMIDGMSGRVAGVTKRLAEALPDSVWEKAQGPEPGIDRPVEQPAQPAAPPEPPRMPGEMLPQRPDRPGIDRTMGRESVREAPEPPTPRSPEPPPPPVAPPEPLSNDSLIPHETPAQQVQRLADAAGLTPRERHIIENRLKGREHTDIVNDPEMRKKKGGIYTRERSRQLEAQALKKMAEVAREEGRTRELASLQKTIVEQEKVDHAVDMMEDGQRVTAQELHVDEREVGQRIGDRTEDLDYFERQRDALTKQMEKEAKHGGLSAKRRDYYVAEFAKLEPGVENPHSVQEGEPASGAGPDAERGGQAPVRNPDAASVPPGPQEPAPASPNEGVAPEGQGNLGNQGTPAGRGNASGVARDYTPEPQVAGIVSALNKAGIKTTGSRGFLDAQPRLGELAKPDTVVVFPSGSLPDAKLTKVEAYLKSQPDLSHIQVDDGEIGFRYKWAETKFGVIADSPGNVQRPAEVWDNVAKMLVGEPDVAAHQEAVATEVKQGMANDVKKEALLGNAKVTDANEAVHEGQRDGQDEALAEIAARQTGASNEAAGGNAGRPAGDAATGATPGDTSGISVSDAPGGIIGRGIKKVLDFNNDEIATLWLPDLQTIKDFVHDRWEAVKRSAQQVSDNWATLSSKQVPAITRLHRETGELAARHAASRLHAEMLLPDQIDRTLGPKVTTEEARLRGAAFTERSLRYTRAAYERMAQAATDPEERNYYAKMAANVTSVIGPDSPITSEAQYQQVVNSPEMKKVFDEWRAPGGMKEIMEDNFRRSQGLDDTDPINSLTQDPDLPINLKAMKEGEQTPEAGKTFGGKGTRGNLRNPTLGKNKFAYSRSGDADYYELDLREIMKNSLFHGLYHASKAEMIRTGVANGVYSWDRDHLFGGEKGREIPRVDPPPGTQANEVNQKTLYADPRAYKETRQILAPDDPTRIPGFTDLAPYLIKASLASTVEMAYHSKNLLTSLMAPGMRPGDLIKNAWGVITKNPEMTKRLIDLAEMGAMKSAGLESDASASKFPPFRLIDKAMGWGGQALDTISKIIRLTAEDAFDRLARQGSAKGTETNKRDFINQLTGNYNKLTQNRFIALLRDTQIGPFATAGSTYLMQGLRSLTLNPGVEATSRGRDLVMRAEMLAKLAGVLSVTAMGNYFLWGRLDGDDKTPLGAIKAGKTPDGKTRSFDLTSLTGFTRGLRATGALAFMEGTRQGRTRGQMLDRASQAWIDNVLHPMEGPAVSFLHTAATGRNSIGMTLAEKVHTGRHREEGESQAWYNLQAALWNANPVLATATGHSRQPGQEMSAEEKFSQLMGPYGFKYRSDAAKRRLGLRTGRS